MDFRTMVELPQHLPPITHTGPLLLMGSCFAENMGSLLTENKFRIDVNPFGILYNPSSISAALHEIREGKIYREEDLFLDKGYWHSLMHHGVFSTPTREETLRNINARLQQVHMVVQELDWLILTWGTAYVYEQKETGRIVSNCHKLPEAHFNRRLLSLDEIVEEYTSLINELTARNPRLKILFTVSPIRHIRDGMHANQLSKSTLLLAIDRLQQLFPQKVFYFPSYEIVLDELRDYRFYADDMLHPSPLAVRYLWERFSDTLFGTETQQVMAAIKELRQGLAHKPFHPESGAYKSFLEQIVLKIERLNRKYPYLDFQKETELCHIRLNP